MKSGLDEPMPATEGGRRSYGADAIQLLKLSAPIGVDLAILFSTFFVDSYFLSAQSEVPAAAVGSLFALFGLIGMILRQVAQAGAVVASYHQGAGEPAVADLAHRCTIWNAIGLGVVIAVATSVCGPTITRLIGLADEESRIAVAYMIALSPGLIALSLKYAFAAIKLTQGRTNSQMVAALAMVAVNILLNWLFQHTSPFGDTFPAQAVGVAIATDIAFAVNALILWAALGGRLRRLPGSMGSAGWSTIREIWTKALPTTTEPAAIQIQHLIVTVFAVSFGTVALAARIYVINIQMFVLVWSLSIAIAVQVLASQAAGARSTHRLNSIVMRGAFISAVGAAAIAFLFYRQSDELIGLFTDDRAVKDLASILFLIVIPTEIAKAIYNTVCWALIGRGDHRAPVVVSVAIMFAVGVPLAWYLTGPGGWGIAGIWIALAVDESLRALFVLGRWWWLMDRRPQAAHRRPAETMP